MFLKTLCILYLLHFSCYADKKANETSWTPELTIDRKQITSVDVSPDGEKTLITYSEKDKELEDKTRICLLLNKNKKILFITPEDESYAEASWSPDGKWISLLIKKGDDEEDIIEVTSPDRFEPFKVLSFYSISLLTWSPDGRKIAFLSRGSIPPLPSEEGDEISYDYKGFTIASDQETKKRPLRIYIMEIDLSRKNFIQPYPISPSTYTLSIGVKGKIYSWSPDSTKIAFSHLPKEGADFIDQASLAITDVKTGKVQELRREGIAADPTFSPDGKTLAFIVGNHKNLAGKIKNNQLPLISLDVCLLDLSNGTRKYLMKTPNEHAEIIGWDSDGLSLIVIDQYKTRQELYSLPINKAPAIPLATNELAVVHFVQLNSSRTFLGFVGESLFSPPEAYMTSLKDFHPIQLTAFHKDLPKLTNVKAEVIHWKSFDGKEIEGIFISPLNYKEGKLLPLFVCPHGGPNANWQEEYIGFNGYPLPFALLANRGFAILAPNVRGSSGYGTDFLQANFRDFGGGDFKDLMSGVDVVIKRGIVDPEKLAIGGWSYGGYLTAWAITQTNCFKAALVGAGLINLISQKGTSSINNPLTAHYGGEYWDIPQKYLDQSPIMHVENIETPTFIQHGEDDGNVGSSQSYELYNALKARKIPVKFFAYRDQSHSLDNKVFLKSLQDAFDWIEQYVKPSKEPQKSR